MSDKICRVCKGEGVIHRDRGKLADNNTIGMNKMRITVCPHCSGCGYDR